MTIYVYNVLRTSSYNLPFANQTWFAGKSTQDRLMIFPFKNLPFIRDLPLHTLPGCRGRWDMKTTTILWWFYGVLMEVVKGLNPSAWSMPPRNSLFWHWPYQRKLRKKRWRQWCDSLVCVKVYVQFEALEIGNGTSSRVSFVMGIDGTQRTLPIIVYTSINLVTIIGWY